MKYVSTRGGGDPVSFEEAVCRGYAPDGGLFVPMSIPEASNWKEWSNLSYAELALKVLTPFVDEDDVEGFRDLVMGCYADFEDPPVTLLEVAPGVKVAELYRGPTLCFKDLGLPFLVRLLAYFATKKRQKKTLLVATSGDTGPAALAAVCSSKSDYLRVICCYPDGMISDFQRKQMTTLSASDRIRVARFDGGGDDMDAPIKRMGVDLEEVCGVNSYNIARPLVQMVHFFWIALRTGGAYDLVIPTGAMGNLVAATFARMRGVPIGKIAAASNSNDFSYRALATGNCRRSETMLKTLSDAINIQVPYNFERLLYLNGCDVGVVESIYSGKDVQLDQKTREKLSECYVASRVDDDRMTEALKFFASGEYVPDPHTSVALAAAQDLGMIHGSDHEDPSLPVVVLATAHACKFEAGVSAALGAEKWKQLSTEFPERVRATLEKPETINVIHLAKLSADEPLEDAQERWESRIRDEIAASVWD